MATEQRSEFDAMLRGGQFAEVLQTAAKVFSGHLTALDPEWVCIAAAKAAYYQKEWHQTLDWVERGLRCLNEVQRTRESAREADGWLHFLLGTVLLYTGDLLRAQKAWTRFQGLAGRVPALARLVPDALFNQAFLKGFIGRHDEEIACYREAAAAYGAVGRQSRVLACRLSVAWAYLLHNQSEAARVELDLLEPELKQNGDAEAETNWHICWALYHQHQRNFVRSEHICRNLDRQPDLSIRQRAELDWLKGWNAFLQEDAPAAEALATEAYQWALQDWWPPQVDRVMELVTAVRGAGRPH